MATITTPTFLDGGVARTAGETWTMNGGVLTVRSDTRWHANAPAGMLGAIGAVTISATLGGGVLLDGRDVRWMAFSAGGGVVPAIGTSVTQGGVTGYLLGVWASVTSAPTAVGAAMPATGFLKFREVTGGPFAAGALVGITADADGADVAGWIEIVQDQSVANTVPRLGYYRTRGDWFYLDDTTGVAGQILQVPTNGGGAGTHVPAVWIETSPGSNEYESYPAILGTWFLAANLSTDNRCKFVQTLGSGQVRIGNDGTANAGFTPPAGCRVRIPNVLGRQTSAANRALNLVPNATIANRPDWTTTSSGDVDFEYFINDWYHAFATPYKVRMINCATFDTHSTSNEGTPTELDHLVIGSYLGTLNALLGTNNSSGGTITNCKFYRAGAATNGHSLSFTGCSNHVFTITHCGVLQYARSTGKAVFSQCRNIEFTQCTVACHALQFSTCSNVRVSEYCALDRLNGPTTSTTGIYAVECFVSCDNVVVDGVRFTPDFVTPVNDNAPYLGVMTASNSSNLALRNVGSPTALADVNASFAPAVIFADGGNNDTVRVQRCFLEATRSNLFTAVNTSKRLLFQNLRGTVGAIQIAALDTLAQGIRSASNSLTGNVACYGTHWYDMLDSDTQGRVVLAFNEPTSDSASQYELVASGAGFGFTSAGNLVMPNVGDEIVFTSPYYMIGHTAFDNSAPVVTATNPANFTLEFDIDVNDGLGFTGTFQTLNAANLTAVTLDPVLGFKFKIRAVVATTNASNALTYIRVTTDSTLADQQAALYPLDYATVTLTGLTAGTRVQLYDTDNSIELYNGVATGTSLVVALPYAGDVTCRVRAHYASGLVAYEFVEFTQALTIAGFTRAVLLVADAVYNANGIDGSTVTDVVIDDSTLLVETTGSTISWAELYAYETHWLTTEVGIRDEGRFIEAIDPANYRLFDFQVKNTGAGPLVITGGYGVSGTTGLAIDVLDTTGGTICVAPEHVVAYATGGGGAPSAATVAAAVWAAHPQGNGSVVADAGNTASTFKTSLTATDNNKWNDLLIKFTSGALAGEVKTIVAYDGTTKVVTVTGHGGGGFSGIPVDGTTFDILNR